MSDTSELDTDLRAVLARIDHDLAEERKLRYESEKFLAEQKKLMAEETKLRSEGRKLERERWLAPWLAIVGLIGGIITAGGDV